MKSMFLKPRDDKVKGKGYVPPSSGKSKKTSKQKGDRKAPSVDVEDIAKPSDAPQAKVSSRVLNMPFMKRSAEQAEAAKREAEEKKKRESMQWSVGSAVLVPKRRIQCKVVSGSLLPSQASNRKSFGHFNPIVEEQTKEASSDKKLSEAMEGSVEVEEMVQRYMKSKRRRLNKQKNKQ